MGVKKLLIIQTDDMYFLHETLQVLSANSRDLSEYDLTLLVSPKALEIMKSIGAYLPQGITTDIKQVLSMDFDLSFNLSLNENAWQIHSEVKAGKKAGPYYQNNELIVSGTWSAWFMTFKGNTPFVTFHMREIFRQILGLKKRHSLPESPGAPKTIIMGMSSPDFFPKDEQEAFLTGLVRRFPGIQVLDESEVNAESDQSSSLYVGPASMKALILSESGGRSIFFGSRFQGLNLLPEKEGTILITTGGKTLDAQSLLGILEIILKEKEMKPSAHLNIYRLNMENVFGAYMECLSGQEIPYPFYQTHLVLWNYLLALQEIHLDIVSPSREQGEIVQTQLEIVTKLLRLHDYAMVSMNGVYKEAKESESDAEKISKHIATLTEVDETMDKIAASNPFLRPMLDFYKIRKGQIEGATLLEKSQNSLLTYSEEHHALGAFAELLTSIRNKK
jgi:hypothetical protein